MAEIRRRGARLHLRLDAAERQALLAILERLGAVAGASPSGKRAYDDGELQAEYEHFVVPELERGRSADLDVIRDSLTAGEDVTTLTDAQALAWVRALNHLRLAAGGIAGVEHDGWEQEMDPKGSPELRILVALGILQEEMVAAIEG